MAVLYTLTINNPKFGEGIEIFPNSITTSLWLQQLIKDVQAIGFIVPGPGMSCGNQFIIFDSEADMNSFINAHRLTDPTLISDLNAWKTAHGITYTTKAYSVSSTAVSITNPLFG